MIDPSLKDDFKSAETKMTHAVDALEGHFKTLRTGRASAALVDKVVVEMYGTSSPLNSVAAVSTPDSRNVVITPWDKNALAAIEKGVMLADIGIHPQNDGKVIRLTIPPLTEDRRKELVKKAHAMAEDARVAVRNVRKHTKEHFEKLKKDKKVLTEDQLHGANEELQKLTDKWIKNVDEHMKKKEKEIMEV
jgi:ribosome recycling factor